jgi:hypothetical protein
MIHNVGKIDRLIRLVLGITLFILYALNVIPAKLETASLFLGGLLLMTSFRRCCPLYAILGFGTCSTGINDKEEPKVKVEKLKL